jgi:hypothetical protein
MVKKEKENNKTKRMGKEKSKWRIVLWSFLVLILVVVGIGVYFYFSLGLNSEGASVPLTQENLPLILQGRLAKYLPDGLIAKVKLGGKSYIVSSNEVSLSEDIDLPPGKFDIEMEGPDNFFEIVEEEGVCSALNTVSATGVDEFAKNNKLAVAKMAASNRDIIGECYA